MKPSKILLLAAGIFAITSVGYAKPPDGKIHLSYWEKWSGAEEHAMQRVVDQFNKSQDRIVVDFLSVGDISRKTLLATAGGDPPDISGLYLGNVCSFIDRNALLPLDDFIREDGSTPGQFVSRYAKAYREMGMYQGKLWGVSSTPTTCALYWNKDMFRAAGLDPEKPPRTVAEMDAMSEKLTRRDDRGNLTQVGFLPQQSGGWLWGFASWFGGGLFDGKNVTIGTLPANLTAYTWVSSYTNRYGVQATRRLTSSFGLSLVSAQDSFMNNQVAMLFDGVWRGSYIHMFAPGLNYGVARWPEAQPGISDFTVAESDMLVIPRGTKHPREAWEFLKFVSSPNLNANTMDELTGVELLCFLQEKASPLTQWSPYFEKNHPNRDLKIFRELAESPHSIQPAKMGIWEEYQREMATTFQKILLEIDTPGAALAHCQDRMESSWRWNSESLARRQKPVATTP